MEIILDDVPLEHRKSLSGLLSAAVELILKKNFDYNPIDEIVVTAIFQRE